ncbi:sensor histidine kinase [Croceicoccus naphthovorans]|uniref:sensor histidine kinase n=1 Tax=Croceicoccus naphthovorans TaxID=1348774 RepID=UPI000B33FEF4|nr:sensor histidine kinase [Croceicoccus naphthovorans]MBB3991184.1 two-component sensor histidine kinase [Croceicoccus naphthovorans]
MIRLPTVERAILRQKSRAEVALWTAASVIIPTAMRLVIDGGEAGVPFVTYFPAVILSALFLGWRSATLTAIFSAIIANRLFRPELPVWDFELSDFIMAGLFAISCGILINVGHIVRQLLEAEHSARDREEMLNAELRHRVRNMLTVIQSLATSTLRHSGPDQFLSTFSKRINALAKATELVTSGEQDSQSIGEIVSLTIDPFRSDGNFRLEGPELKVPNAACVPLALALHELCTNAVKYGSLSNSDGNVTITWEGAHSDDQVAITWKESGGPMVKQPTRKGMGSGLLRPGRGLDSVELEFRPDGVKCAICLKVTPGSVRSDTARAEMKDLLDEVRSVEEAV